jgi:hypothetical protein
MIKSSVLAAAVAVAVAALAGCGSSGHPVNTGPFGGQGETIGRECVPIKSGQIFTYGSVDVRNSGPQAVIDKVALARPRTLRLLAAWAVPVTGDLLYGDQLGYPPGHMKMPGFQWAMRMKPDGAVVPHARHHNDVTNIVLVLQPVGDRGSALGVDVFYHVGSQQYHYRSGIGLTVVTPPLRC